MEGRSKVLAVPFHNLRTWNVAAQFAVRWSWKSEFVIPLGSVLERRQEHSLETLSRDSIVHLLTIRFDGSIEARDPIRIKNIKGKLFRAYPGDVVFSKIDVRNGAIGLAPEDIDNMCVTSEFPVYSVKEGANSDYIKLLFRTAAFKNLLNSMISGASGRKRIQPSQLEDVEVPIPPLPIQQKIVAYWDGMQSKISSAKRKKKELASKAENEGLEKIGIQVSPVVPRKGCFCTKLSQNERWDTFFFREDFLTLETQIASMPHISLGDALHFINRGWKATDFPSGNFEYIEISAVNKESGIVSTRTVETNSAPSRATTKVREGDLMISTTRPYLGAFAMVDKEHDGCICSSGFSVAIDVGTDSITKEFILYFLKTPAGLRQMERRMTGGLYPAIVQSELEKIIVPLPAVSVQKDIVSHYEQCNEMIAKLDYEITKFKADAEQRTEKLILGTLSVEEL